MNEEKKSASSQYWKCMCYLLIELGWRSMKDCDSFCLRITSSQEKVHKKVTFTEKYICMPFTFLLAKHSVSENHVRSKHKDPFWNHCTSFWNLSEIIGNWNISLNLHMKKWLHKERKSFEIVCDADLVQQLQEIAPRYDYDEKSPGNGYRYLLELHFHFRVILWTLRALFQSKSARWKG